MRTVMILGSGPNVTQARGWARAPFDHILAINNAHAVRADWDALIHAHDFPADRRPMPGAGQRLVTEDDFVPVQNRYGGFVYAGGTMAFTAGYWALGAEAPGVIGLMGCDMHYPANGPTHFYGRGSPDPLRPDVTLQSLEAKSARLMVLAAMQGCAVVNLSQGPSRLALPRVAPAHLRGARPAPWDAGAAHEALAEEKRLGYLVPSGRYWEEAARFDADALAALDDLWLAAARVRPARIA
ncbi:MAG: hypothetical protein ACK4L4_05270 [Gemmobacter sp.]